MNDPAKDAEQRKQSLLERAQLPVRITDTGVFIGGEEFPHPIAEGSVHVQRAGKRFNAMTLTLFVGEVTVEPGSKALPPALRVELANTGWLEAKGRPAFCLVHNDKYHPNHPAGAKILDFYSTDEARRWLTDGLAALDEYEAEKRAIEQAGDGRH